MFAKTLLTHSARHSSHVVLKGCHRVSGAISQAAWVQCRTQSEAASSDSISPSMATHADQWVSYQEGSDTIYLQLNDKSAIPANTSWLRHNCRGQLQEGSGQKLVSFDSLIPPCLPRLIETDGDDLHIVWDSDGHESRFDRQWLSEHLGMVPEQQKPPHVAGSPPTLKSLDYSFVVESGRGTWEWLNTLREEGMCRLTGAPGEPGAVVELANLISEPQQQMYGATWDVKVDESPINVAYSCVGLPLHQDLVYYESPPGLQFLHCLSFNPEVEGGESTLLDSASLLMDFRKRHPRHFETLCRVPVRFQKVHSDRDVPACYVYHRPIISLCPNGNIIQFTWSPPFEGPLPIQKTPEQTTAFYEAYCSLAAAIENSKEILEFRLKEREVITFNNRRVLHGRKAFSSRDGAPPSRTLQGCYVNIDEFRSKHITLGDTYADKDDVCSESIVWNQDAPPRY